MPIENPENWFLRKHDDGTIFGPVPFEKIREWARSAQVNPQDMVSQDKEVWTKAPMIPELEMDWLVVVDEKLLYGPTTADALLEFVQIGEITPDTRLINCGTGESTVLNKTPFFKAAEASAGKDHTPESAILNVVQQPVKGGLRANLQKRIRELELALLEKHRQLVADEEIITRLEAKVKELETRLREVSGFRA